MQPRYMFLILFLFTPSLVEAADRPNVLLIVADDLGYSDLGCYGGEIETPNLDFLASHGARLTRFYNMGRCCPSRTSILTGQYPHRVGVGHKVADLGSKHPGYRGRIPEDVKTIAEVLQPAGYRSFISGKWHLGTPDPTKHGFEQFYGTLVSAKTFWDADHYMRLPAREPKVKSEEPFYGTDATTDHALDFLNRARQTPDQPWFLYLAYQAPHFPAQARRKDIAKYEETYQCGWDVIREQRLERMKELGIVSASTELTPRSQYWNFGETKTGRNPAWDTLPKERQADLAQRMAIYAAMVDSIDQNVGRLTHDLLFHGEFENTLIIFLSDNGACGEWDPFGFDITSSNQNILHTGDALKKMGGPDTYHSVGSGWANASNTPWRLQKHFNHEGGINSPCIVHWPSGKLSPNAIEHAPTHIIDLLPTVAAAAETDVNISMPMPGKNFLPLLADPTDEVQEQFQQRPLFFEHEGNRAVHSGRWKLVALRDKPWELYDIAADRTELNNLAASQPDVVKDLERQWNQWAKDNFVTPLPEDYGVKYLRSATPSARPEVKATYRDNYGALKHPKRRAMRGDWQFDDRVARCTHQHEGERKNSGVHGPVIWYDLPFQDGTLRYSMKPDKDVMAFLFTINGADGHIFRLMMKQPATTIKTYPREDEPRGLLGKTTGLAPDEWTDVVVTLKDDQAIIKIGEEGQTVSHPALKQPKSTIGLGISYGTIELRDFSFLNLK